MASVINARAFKVQPVCISETPLTKPGDGMDATGLMAREGRSASAALTAGLSITWQQHTVLQQCLYSRDAKHSAAHVHSELMLPFINAKPHTR